MAFQKNGAPSTPTQVIDPLAQKLPQEKVEPKKDPKQKK